MAAAWLGLAPSVSAAPIFKVDGSHNLNQIATEIAGSTERGTYLINFATHQNVGQFKLSQPVAADSLIFQNDAETDAFVTVGTGPLFDLKKMKGVVMLRGMAFGLSALNSVLISGADQGNKNHSLILDSCFIFGESLNSTFLSWVGDAGSKIEIRRSFLVSKSGQDTLGLSADTVDIRNTNFNFAGMVSTSTTVRLQLDHNTVNRTQFKCAGNLTSTYKIVDNLFAHHSQFNALLMGGPAAIYPISLTGFDESLPGTARNLRYKSTAGYKGWAAFEPPGNGRFNLVASNDSIAPIPGKDTTELWNWYLPETFTVGHGNGAGKRASRYNTFPGDSKYATTLEGKSASFFFRPAAIPRELNPQLIGLPLDSTVSESLRLLWPGRRGIKIGVNVSVTLDSLVLESAPNYNGKPILLAYEPSRYQEPGPEAQRQINSKVFKNFFPSAVFFHPAYFCSTPRGTQVNAGGLSVSQNDSLRFGRVDSAGVMTFLVEQNPPSFPKAYRYLNTQFGYSTTAVLGKDAMVFGTSLKGPQPFRTDSVFWWWKTQIQDTLFPARLVNGRFISNAPTSESLNAYLVERLSVPRDGGEFYFRDGWVKASSPKGFQLEIDSTGYKADTLSFGLPTRGVRFSWAGRADADSVVLYLKHLPNQDAMRDSAGKLAPIPWTPDTGGYGRITIGKADADKAFFMGIRYNVVGGKTFGETVDGVKVANLLSSTNGKLSFQPAGVSVLGSDTNFQNLEYRIGKVVARFNLNISAPWEMTLTIPSFQDKAAVVAYAGNGNRWTLLNSVFLGTNSSDLRILDIPTDSKWVVVVEKVKPGDTYVDAEFVLKPGPQLEFSVAYKDPSNRKINFYEVELMSMDRSGNVESIVSPRTPVGETFIHTPEKDRLLSYRLQYYSDSTAYGRQKVVQVQEIKWDLAGLKGSMAPKAAFRWHALGFPFAGSFKKYFKVQQGPPLPKGTLDITEVLELKNEKTGARFVTVPKLDALTFKIGEAYLFSSARAYKLEIDSSALETFQPLGEFRITANETGWKLISSPFPASFPVSKIRSDQGSAPFQHLDDYDVPGQQGKSYRWVTTSSLEGFKGYAYYFLAGETLTFDPMSDGKTGPQVTAKIAALPAGLDVVVTSPSNQARMTLHESQAFRNVPYLPSFGGGLEMRLGGEGGYLQKRIPSFKAIDESLDLTVGKSCAVSFELVGKETPQVSLLHLSSGRVFTGSELSAIPLAKGVHNFRLVAGGKAFVAEKVNAFLAGAPRELTLSQNFPNPVRRLTQISLEWPMARGPGERRAVLEVFDMGGRRVHRLELDRIRVGRQLLTLDASAWSPGVYVYRLVVSGSGQRIKLQKKMLVSE